MAGLPGLLVFVLFEFFRQLLYQLPWKKLVAPDRDEMFYYQCDRDEGHQNNQVTDYTAGLDRAPQGDLLWLGCGCRLVGVGCHLGRDCGAHESYGYQN